MAGFTCGLHRHNLLVTAHGFIARTLRTRVRRDFSDAHDWQLNNGPLRVLDDPIALRDPLPTSGTNHGITP